MLHGAVGTAQSSYTLRYYEVYTLPDDAADIRRAETPSGSSIVLDSADGLAVSLSLSSAERPAETGAKPPTSSAATPSAAVPSAAAGAALHNHASKNHASTIFLQ